MDFKFNATNDSYELTNGNYFIRYEVTNSKVYTVEVHDNFMLESISIFLSKDELFRIINNPRLAFYI